MAQFQMKAVRRRRSMEPTVQRPALPATLGLVLLGIVCIAVGIERTLVFVAILLTQGVEGVTFLVLTRVLLVGFAGLAGGLAAFFRGATALWEWQKTR